MCRSSDTYDFCGVDVEDDGSTARKLKGSSPPSDEGPSGEGPSGEGPSGEQGPSGGDNSDDVTSNEVITVGKGGCHGCFACRGIKNNVTVGENSCQGYVSRTTCALPLKAVTF